MPIHNLSEIESRRSVHAPICIVGAGVAGLLAGLRLAHAGRRVVLIESGGRAFDEAVHKLNELGSGAPYAREMTGHYRGLGGSSTRWGGRMIPISAAETMDRPHLGLSGWAMPYGALAPYRAVAERLMELSPGSFEEEALNALDPAGVFPRGHADFVCRWQKWPSFARCNLATALADEIERADTLEIWLDATVTDFTFDAAEGRLTGVTARSLNGRVLSLTADDFILACGTIESTRLLLWLDRQSGERAFERTDVLGRYFQDHLNVDLGEISRRNGDATNRLFGYRFAGGTRRSWHLELSPEAQRTDSVASAFAYVHMDLDRSVLSTVKRMARELQRRSLDISAKDALTLSQNLGVMVRSAYWRYGRRQLFVPQDVSLRLHLCVEQTPDRHNRILLSDETDRLAIPKAQLNWSPKPADERTFRAAVGRLADYWRDAGFEKICPVDWICVDGDRAGDFAGRAEDYAHPSGSARMGHDPRMSIVGPDLRCHHVPNLSVVGAATFPSAGSANPTMTIMQQALHLSDAFLSAGKALAA